MPPGGSQPDEEAFRFALSPMETRHPVLIAFSPILLSGYRTQLT